MRKASLGRRFAPALVAAVAIFAVAAAALFPLSTSGDTDAGDARDSTQARAERPSPSATETVPSSTRVALIGKVRSGADIVARVEPESSSEAIETFPSVNEQGSPQVFLLQPEGGEVAATDEWVPALLPVRPNGTTGYLPLEDLEILSTDYMIEVDRSEFELTVWEGDEVIMRVPISLGTGETPTPTGLFYLASLLELPDPTTVYGPYAYGISGYSETLTDWKGGGIIGLHGTNDPKSIGKAVSHGCIRMRNADIKRLIPLLPLGTPIEIT